MSIYRRPVMWGCDTWEQLEKVQKRLDVDEGWQKLSQDLKDEIMKDIHKTIGSTIVEKVDDDIHFEENPLPPIVDPSAWVNKSAPRKKKTTTTDPPKKRGRPVKVTT